MDWKRRRRHRKTIDVELTQRQRDIVLSALLVWRSQLGRVASGQPIPGLASADAIKEVDELAQLLAKDSKTYSLGVGPSHVDQRPLWVGVR